MLARTKRFLSKAFGAKVFAPKVFREPSEAVDPFVAVPGQANIVDEGGTRGYRTNAPTWYGRQQYCERENGGAGGPRVISGALTANPGQGLGGWKNSWAGAGTARTVLTGKPSWFSGAASIETGTTTTGSYALTLASDPAMAIGPASGVLTYKGKFQVPALSDGTDTFVIAIGPGDNSNGKLVVDGVFLRYQYDVNGGRWQLVARDNSSETVDDTGVTVVAGDYIRVMIRVTGDSLAEAWVYVTQTGVGAWSDDGTWSSTPHASLSTGIPSGIAREFQCGPAICKTAGTNSRKLNVGRQSVSWVAESGQQPGMVRYIDENGDTGWTHPQFADDPIVHIAYHRGGWLPSASTDFGIVTSGTQPAVDAFAQDNGGLGTTRLRTQAVATQYAGLVTACNLVIDSDTDVQVFEAPVAVPTLSTVAQTHRLIAGHFNDYVSAPTRGITVELDSQASANFQCICRGPSGTTTVDSGIPAVAGTYVMVRIVETPTSIAFYVRAFGTAYGSPVATITTNIPTGVDLMAGVLFRKSNGTTNVDAYVMYILTYMRCTTNANANYGKVRIAEDDNSGTVGATFTYRDNVPDPRTQPFVILSTAHLGAWGSSDFGANAGGDASMSDLTHHNPFTITTGTTTTGHVALGTGGDVAGIVFSATSGLTIFDYVGQIEAVSDGTQTHFVRLGLPSHTYNAVTNGIYLTVDANTSANVQLVVVANSVATTTDTGIPWAAATWYRARIEVSNNTEVRLWMAADDAAWPSTPTATVTTNIPSGTTQAVKACITIKKSAGTTPRKLATSYGLVARDRYAA